MDRNLIIPMMCLHEERVVIEPTSEEIVIKTVLIVFKHKIDFVRVSYLHHF